jgi:diguanylate cyclase (GGDEF)-like protein
LCGPVEDLGVRTLTTFARSARAEFGRAPGVTGLLTAGLMTVYETAKQTLLPPLTLWQSHAITIGFTTVLATALALMVSRRTAALYAQLSEAKMEIELQLEQRQRFRELTELLQTARTRDEVSRILERHLESMFPDADGGLFLFSPSRDVVEPLATWGSVRTSTGFAVDECWGLRLGKAYGLRTMDNAVPCEHVDQASPGEHLCIPMHADGETLGVFHLRTAPAPSEVTERWAQAEAVASRLALPLANLRLRETLRNQSIRDGLTGVFNRYYMEESLAREVRRSIRHGATLSVAVLDLDHFKQVNDAHGHGAGDDALRLFGRFLAMSVREEDIVCRFGGEEFVVLLPEVDTDGAVDLVDRLRMNCGAATLGTSPTGRPPITFSAGVASLPADGMTPEELLKAADRALYQAKSAGRNRVVGVDETALDAEAA